MRGSQEVFSGGSAATLTCRRCARAFERPAAEVVLPSCPHCGASVRPLWEKIRDNRNAAVLALIALPVLMAGMFLPFISISKMGHERIVSLVGGIQELFERKYFALGSVLLVFSVVFPIAKLVAILIATSALVPIGDRGRHRLHHLAHLTGKYSLLDILVVAIMIVVIKFDGLAEIRAESGTILFMIAVFLSIAAGTCVNFDHLRSGRQRSITEGTEEHRDHREQMKDGAADGRR